MKIRYEATSFDPAVFPLLVASGDIGCQWRDLVWAAITCGKRCPFYWASHPWHSLAEALARTWSLYAFLAMKHGRPVRSSLYKSMDPTEKGAASYFLGMTLTKLAAEQLLDTPWIFHVSTAVQALSFKPGKSRPDFLGCMASSLDWVVLEAKGRSRGFCADTLAKAKQQSRMVATINGKVPCCRVGVQSYFSPDLRMKLVDPPEGENAQPVEISVEHAFQSYYAIRIALRQSGVSKVIAGRECLVLTDFVSGVTIGLPRVIVVADNSKDFLAAVRDAPYEMGRKQVSFTDHIYRDGFYIALDDRWSDDQMILDPAGRGNWNLIQT